ncbi:MAG: ATP-dependent Clp protease ATP-binding subunit [Clostridia bacterium]|nr:ATP-dependent Clp protease ATP-binding subunit [Clostridia bacterium]
MEQTPLIPKWHRELELFSGIKSLLILEGNVMDQYRYPTDGSVKQNTVLPLSGYLHTYFRDSGYDQIIFYSNLVGFVSPYDPDMLERYAALTETKIKNGAIPSEFKGNDANTAPNVIRRALGQQEAATVTVMEMASHYITTPERMDQQDVNSFNILLQSALSASLVRTTQGKKQNLLILLVNKLNDLPVWFYLNNPVCKVLTLEAPDREERKRFLEGENLAGFFSGTVYRREMPYYREHPEELDRLREKFVGLTEGLTFTELEEMRKLCRNEETSIHDLCKVVDLYKYGIKENPWSTLSVKSLKTAKRDFEKRIKGQDTALERTLDVVKRAVTGMNGLNSSNTGKPKGVLFYAGPTGTGKTETAKALAEKLFGDESNCIRFDMSEYGQSHSDQKLMGAPPGYVGYEAGGQLTNAVKKNPFCILLFDEIEKAHTSILDKFLQILEDGRMTDGQGNTVYFSECIIIFTSNLGIYVKDALGNREPNVTMDMPYKEVQTRVRTAIEDYFKLELGRPEILNRIGENIVVFDYIREDAARLILRAQTDKIISRLREQKNIRIRIEDHAYEGLEKAATFDLSNGGRGIGNQVESLMINPLSRWLFDHEITEDADLVIEAFETASNPPAIRCRIEGGEA